MAAFEFGDGHPYAAGTLVAAYEDKGQNPSGSPMGPGPVSSATVEADGDLVIDGLAEGVRYWAVGSVNGSHRWVSIYVQRDFELPIDERGVFELHDERLDAVESGQLDGLAVGPIPVGSDPKKYVQVGMFYDAAARKSWLEGIANVLEIDDTPEIVGRRLKGDYATRVPAICKLSGVHAAGAGTFTVALPAAAPYTRTTGNPTDGFGSTGRFVVRNPTTTRVAKIAYTGKTPEGFTGCTVIAENGTGDFVDGAEITGLLLDQTTLMNIYPMPFTGQDGWQERGSAIGMKLAEDAWYDGRGYSTGSEIVHTIMSLGPNSQRVLQWVENTEGFLVLLGDAAPTVLESGRQGAFRLHIGGPFTRVAGAQTFPLTGDRLETRYTAGWPTAGNISIGGITGYAYTGRDGPFLTGCTGPAGAVVDAAAVRLEDVITSVAADGRLSARQGRTGQTRIGAEGPAKEGGISAGSAADTVMHRAAAGVWQPDLFRWKSGNEQTTVGAAGGASALPATPTLFLKVQRSNGTVLVVPAYAAS